MSVLRLAFVFVFVLGSAVFLAACGGDNSAEIAKSFVDAVVIKHDVSAAMKMLDTSGKASVDRAGAEKRLTDMMPKLKAFDVRDLRIEPKETREPSAEDKAKGINKIRSFDALYSVRSGDTGGAFVESKAVVTLVEIAGAWAVTAFEIPTEAKRG
ncbi:MAG: hypothetical protein HY331_02160 [Chloroflexi bacterium]|nr:hypothetical protein [Chloroflexota bacterium]